MNLKNMIITKMIRRMSLLLQTKVKFIKISPNINKIFRFQILINLRICELTKIHQIKISIYSMITLFQLNQKKQQPLQMIFNKNLKRKFVEIGKCQNVHLNLNVRLPMVNMNFCKNLIYLKIIAPNNVINFTNCNIARMVIDVNFIIVKNLNIKGPFQKIHI